MARPENNLVAISCKVTQLDRDIIRELSAAREITVSDWLRDLIRKEFQSASTHSSSQRSA